MSVVIFSNDDNELVLYSRPRPTSKTEGGGRRLHIGRQRSICDCNDLSLEHNGVSFFLFFSHNTCLCVWCFAVLYQQVRPWLSLCNLFEGSQQCFTKQLKKSHVQIVIVRPLWQWQLCKLAFSLIWLIYEAASGIWCIVVAEWNTASVAKTDKLENKAGRRVCSCASSSVKL